MGPYRAMTEERSQFVRETTRRDKYPVDLHELGKCMSYVLPSMLNPTYLCLLSLRK